MRSAPWSPRAGERGSAMVVMMIVMVALGTIASLTVISVQGGSATVNAHRFDAIALYAAESGAMAAMNWLKVNYDDDDPSDPIDSVSMFSQYVDENNANPPSPVGIPGNNAQPGSPENLFSPDQQAWYEVRILNNRSDPGLDDPGGVDTDGVVIIDVTGHGPNGAVKRLEWEIYRAPNASLATPDESPIVLIGWRELF